MSARLLLSLLLPLAACSSGSLNPGAVDAKAADAKAADAKAVDAPAIDAGSSVDAKLVDAAPPPIDAPPTPATVVAVTCPASGIPVVLGTDNTFQPPATTTTVNGIVKFTMPSSHNVVPDPSGSTDTGLHVDFNETKCLKFTMAGTFHFMCDPHAFQGTITVN